MASTITLSNLSNGQQIFLPYLVNISISGQNGAKITSVSRQIDSGALQGIGGWMPALPATPVASSTTLNGLSVAGHSITIYASDDQSQNPTTLTVNFSVISMPPPGP